MISNGGRLRPPPAISKNMSCMWLYSSMIWHRQSRYALVLFTLSFPLRHSRRTLSASYSKSIHITSLSQHVGAATGVGQYYLKVMGQWWGGFNEYERSYHAWSWRGDSSSSWLPRLDNIYKSFFLSRESSRQRTMLTRMWLNGWVKDKASWLQLFVLRRETYMMDIYYVSSYMCIYSIYSSMCGWSESVEGQGQMDQNADRRARWGWHLGVAGIFTDTINNGVLRCGGDLAPAATWHAGSFVIKAPGSTNWLSQSLWSPVRTCFIKTIRLS